MPVPTARELGPYAALGHRFVVRCDHPAVAAYLDTALATLACDDRRTTTSGSTDPVCYEITRDDDRDRFATYVDGEELATAASARRAIGMVIWHVNRSAVESAVADHVVLHAAAVARDGQALVLPAAMEAGKTTLAAGLIDRGWAYLTDEAVALPLDGSRVRAYPKPLSIDAGSQEVLADWRPPDVDDALPPLRRGQWQVPATARPGGSVTAEAELGAIVLPRYTEGADTALSPLSRAATMARAAECTFAWQGEQLRERFAALAAAVRRSACGELVVGDLDAACETVEAFWEEHVAR